MADLQTAPFGGKKPRSEGSSYTGSMSLSLSWKDLTYRVGHRDILKGLTGQALPSRTLAIMGSSGAGKTTLLNALCDRLATDKERVMGGTRMLNEVEYDSHYRKLIGFVTQDDVVSTMSTPEDALKFSLRIRRGTDPETTQERVDAMLEELHLQNSRNTVVGIPGLVAGLSGGERKRCNIGVELIADPKILLLDEPTSGLDSFTSAKIISLVKDLAARGRTVIFSIHQPTADCVSMFDDLLLMCQGRVAYHGTMANAVPYFESVGFRCPEDSTPTDYFMTLLQNEKIGAELVEKWSERIQHSEHLTAHLVPMSSAEAVPGVKGSTHPPETSRDADSTKAFLEEYVASRRSSIGIQIVELFRRSAVGLTRNKMYITMIFVQSLFFALFNGVIFVNLKDNIQGVQDRFGLLFMVTVNKCFSGAMMMINTFPQEKAVFIREQQSGAYSPTVYFFAKTLTELPVFLLSGFVEAVIIYFMSGLAVNAGAFFYFYAVTQLVFQATAGLGLTISVSIDSYVLASALAPLCIVPMMLAGGLLAATSRLRPAWVWLEKISVVRYGFVLLAKNEFERLDFVSCNYRDFTGIANATDFCSRQPKNGEQALKQFELNTDGELKWIMWLCLAAWVVFFRVLCIFALKRAAARSG